MMKTKADKKIEKVMHEFKEVALKSCKGGKVTDRKQAIAIALSEAGNQNTNNTKETTKK